METTVVYDVCNGARREAERLGAWKLAARFAQAALRAALALQFPVATLARLECTAGYAASFAADSHGATVHLRNAISHAREVDDLNTWGRAVVQLAREPTSDDVRADAAVLLREADLFTSAASVAVPAHSAAVHGVCAELCFNIGNRVSATRHADDAEYFLSLLEDAVPYAGFREGGPSDRERNEIRSLKARIAFGRGLQQFGAIELDDAASSFARVRSLVDSRRDPMATIWAHGRLGLVEYVRGDLVSSTQLLTKAEELARSANNAAELALGASVNANVAVLQGRDATAIACANRAQLARPLDDDWFMPSLLYPAIVRRYCTKGDLDGALNVLAKWGRSSERASRRYVPLVHALCGEVDYARMLLAEATTRWMTGTAPTDVMLLGAAVAQIELAVLCDRRDQIATPLEMLERAYTAGARCSMGWPALLAHVIAIGHVAVESSGATQWFRRAETDGENAQVPPSSVVPTPKIPTRRVVANAFEARTILATGLVWPDGKNGDRPEFGNIALLQAHDAIVRKHLVANDGIEFRQTSNGIVAWFFSAHLAVECASAIANAFAEKRRHFHEQPLHLRIALATGES